MRLPRYVFARFLPMFLGGIAFFVLILQLVEIFTNLTGYVQNGVSTEVILQLQLLQVPLSITFGLPIAFVFAASYTMGDLQTHNEILAFFATGFSIRQIVAVIFFFAIITGGASFVIQEFMAVPGQQEKKLLADKALNRPVALSTAGLQVYDKSNGLVYQAQYFNAETLEIQGLDLVRRSSEGEPVQILMAERAVWLADESRWKLFQVRVMDFLPNRDQRFSFENEMNPPDISISPKAFQSLDVPFESLTLSEAIDWIELRRVSGLNYRMEETRLMERVAFAFIPMVLALLAVGVGRKFRKHVFLLSLMVSIGLAVLYYGFQLTGSHLAGIGLIPPVVGAWASVVVFLLAGGALLWKDQRR